MLPFLITQIYLGKAEKGLGYFQSAVGMERVEEGRKGRPNQIVFGPKPFIVFKEDTFDIIPKFSKEAGKATIFFIAPGKGMAGKRVLFSFRKPLPGRSLKDTLKILKEAVDSFLSITTFWEFRDFRAVTVDSKKDVFYFTNSTHWGIVRGELFNNPLVFHGGEKEDGYFTIISPMAPMGKGYFIYSLNPLSAGFLGRKTKPERISLGER